MTILIPSWRPKRREVYYTEKPEWVPEYIYSEAVTAKRFYNENWEYWVWTTAQDYNCSVAKAEDACIRGLKKTLLQAHLVYGEKVGKWYEDFLEMKDIFSKVTLPIYLPQLGE